MLNCSIVIPTVELNSLTNKCIKICHNYYPNSKIFVICDRYNERLAEVINENVIYFEVGLKTIAYKRNYAFSKSNSKYIALIDSDAYPEKYWIENSIKYFEDNRDIAVIGGPNISPYEQTQSESLVGLMQKSILITGLGYFKKSISKSRYCNNLPTCNLIIKREYLSKIGLFNEEQYVGEDRAFCHKVIKSGHKIFFAKDVVVFHKNRDLKLFLFQRISYGTGIVPNLKRNIKDSPMLLAPIAILVSYFIVFFTSKSVYFLPFTFIVLVHIISCLVESIRVKEKIFELPILFVLLAFYSVMPGVGMFLSLSKKFRGVNFYNIVYKNN